MADETSSVRGIELPIDRRLMAPWICKAILEGTYETLEASAIEQHVKPGDRVVDIGAGIGFTSAVSSRSGAAVVYAFEADARLLPLIQKTFTLNRIANVDVFNLGVVPVGAKSQCELYIRDGFWSSSLYGNTKPYASVASCPAIHIDKLIRDYSPTVIVSDSEGSEFELFGSIKLNGVRSIIVEVHMSVMQSVDAAPFGIPNFVEVARWSRDAESYIVCFERC